jgi:hypothetical protein
MKLKKADGEEKARVQQFKWNLTTSIKINILRVIGFCYVLAKHQKVNILLVSVLLLLEKMAKLMINLFSGEEYGTPQVMLPGKINLR